MPGFGSRSRSNLDTCHPLLVLLAETAIIYVDFSVTEGHRGERLQNQYFERGLSKLRYPESRHNRTPSEAMHCEPYPHPGYSPGAERDFIYLAGILKGTALLLGVPLRWGGDWNRNYRNSDERFHDLAHFELDCAEL